jgi:hypothetical protein
MSTRVEKLRKLRALGRSPNPHEAARAWEKVRELEAGLPTAEGLAQDMVALLEARGLKVRVWRNMPDTKRDSIGLERDGIGFDVDIAYRVSTAKEVYRPRHTLMISILEYGPPKTVKRR